MLAMLIAGVGCSSTHRSVLPPYVRELRPAAGGFEMVQCESVLTVTETQGVNWFWFFNTSKIETNLAQGQCWNAYVPAEVTK
jgi:hypothetical protein